MAAIDEELKGLNEELERLQNNLSLKIDEYKEINNFIIETKAHQFAITNLICGLIATKNSTTLSSERDRYEVFRKGRLIELLKNWILKYKNISQSKTSPPSSN